MDESELISALKSNKDSMINVSNLFIFNPTHQLGGDIFEMSLFHNHDFSLPPVVLIEHLVGAKERISPCGNAHQFSLVIDHAVRGFLKDNKDEKSSICFSISRFLGGAGRDYEASSHAIQWFVLPEFEGKLAYKIFSHAGEANELVHILKSLTDTENPNSLYCYLKKELKNSQDRANFKQAIHRLPIITKVPRVAMYEFGFVDPQNKMSYRAYKENLGAEALKSIGVDVNAKDADVNFKKQRTSWVQKITQKQQAALNKLNQT